MSMDSSVDTRRIRRQAKSLLKSASCGDRIVAQNIGKCRMQSTSKFDSVISLQGGGSQSSQFLGGENSLLFQQSSVEAMSRPSTRQYKEKHFKQRCWEIFTKYGRMPGDQPLDQCTLGLPSHSLEAAMSELMGRSVPKEAKGKSLMEGNISLSWSDFKSYAKDVFANLPGGSEDMFNNSSSYGGGGSLDELDTSMFSGSYKHLLQRHRSASHIVFDDLEDRNISDNNHGSLKISEKLVPISIVKDAAVKILRKESTELRKGKGKCEGERSVSQLKGPTTTEVESSTSVLKISMSDSMKSLLDTSELAATSTTNDSQHLRRNSLDISFPHIRPFETKMDLSAGFTKLTEKQRMVGLFNQAEEYPSKWLAMKTKRDERRAREEARRNRNNIRHSVQQIVMNAERSEFDRVQEEILHTREDTVMRNKMLQDEKNFAMKHNIKTRREKDRETKRREAMYLRDTIDDSTSAMKSMLNDEVSTIRKKNAQNAFELNSVTSTIIPIPDKLQANLRNAKSLMQYTAAKKAIKEFFENTMSAKIAQIAHNKRMALDSANNDSPNIRKTPFNGSSMFTDTFTLHTNSLIEDSLGDNGSRSLGSISGVGDNMSGPWSHAVSSQNSTRGGGSRSGGISGGGGLGGMENTAVGDDFSWISDVKRSNAQTMKTAPVVNESSLQKARMFRSKYK